nr:WAS/WASL-interacting protein family member 1-like [Equus asinus]
MPSAPPPAARPAGFPGAGLGPGWGGAGGRGRGAGGGSGGGAGAGAGAGAGRRVGSGGGAGAGAGRRWSRDRGQDRAQGLRRRGSRARPEQRGVGGGGAQGGPEGPDGCCRGTEALPPPLLSRARGLHPRDPAGCASAGRPEAWGAQSALSWSWSALAHRPARTPTRPCRPGQRPECRPDGEGAAPRVPPPPRLGPQPELGHPPRRVAAAGPGALGRRAGPGLRSRCHGPHTHPWALPASPQPRGPAQSPPRRLQPVGRRRRRGYDWVFRTRVERRAHSCPFSPLPPPPAHFPNLVVLKLSEKIRGI